MTPHARGAWLGLLGTLILTPDTLFMRLSELDPIAMTAWRGVLMCAAFFAIWLMTSHNRSHDLRQLLSSPALLVIFCQICHIFLFSYGVAVAPVAYVLLGLATVPIVSALLSRYWLSETLHPITWLTISCVLIGLIWAIFAGHDANLHEISAAIYGALAGLGVALMIACSFLTFRIHNDLPITLTMGIGAGTGGIIAAAITGPAALFAGHIAAILPTGLLILPLSFLCLSAASRLTRTTTVSLLMLLETILGPLWLWLALAEPITPGMIGGGSLVILSLAAYLYVERLINIREPRT